MLDYPLLFRKIICSPPFFDSLNNTIRVQDYARSGFSSQCFHRPFRRSDYHLTLVFPWGTFNEFYRRAYFRLHATDPELTFFKERFCLGDRNKMQRLLRGAAKINKSIFHRRQNKENVCANVNS